MDNIDKALKYAETGIRPALIADDEPTEIYDAIDRLKEHNQYYFLTWYTNTYEFIRAKLTRANSVPKTDENEKDIKIEIIENPSDTTIP